MAVRHSGWIILLVIVGLAPNPTGAQTERLDLVRAVRLESPIDFCGEPVPTGDAAVAERFEKEMLLSLWDRDQAVLWLKRSTRYLPIIEKFLAEAGMPDDLKYVAVAESALRPHAGSPKGAIGFWQFLADTGRKYGLRIDSRIDERRSLKASTRAA
ncbi:MAG: transglycosylase SLT domain-containing protein, partial [Desulfobacterales bacterium]|nr:transglycosylase SLT domain-containing protein [Desulfobacterales bacterium]